MKHLKSAQITELQDRMYNLMRDLLKDIRRELLQSDKQHHRLFTNAADESVSSLAAHLYAAGIDLDMRELRAIEAARRRLQTGEYGVCLDCSNYIAWPRLLAEPAAERCLQCAQEYEKTHAHLIAAPELDA